MRATRRRSHTLLRRSREGAWIEIAVTATKLTTNARRSREGAWIEIQGIIKGLNKDARRSREGAWIEIADSYSVAEAVKASLP